MKKTNIDPAALLVAVLAAGAAPLSQAGEWGYTPTLICAVVLVVMILISWPKEPLPRTALLATSIVVAFVAGVGLAWPAQRTLVWLGLATYTESSTEIFRLGDNALIVKLSNTPDCESNPGPDCELTAGTINHATVLGLIFGAVAGLVYYLVMRRRHLKDNGQKGAMAITDPHVLHSAWAERFNATDLQGMVELYEPDAVLITPPGSSTTGEGIRQKLQDLLRLGLPISVNVRQLHVTGDLALVLADWSIKDTGANSSPAGRSWTTTDVLRRGDGGWKLAFSHELETN